MGASLSLLLLAIRWHIIIYSRTNPTTRTVLISQALAESLLDRRSKTVVPASFRWIDIKEERTFRTLLHDHRRKAHQSFAHHWSLSPLSMWWIQRLQSFLFWKIYYHWNEIKTRNAETFLFKCPPQPFFSQGGLMFWTALIWHAAYYWLQHRLGSASNFSLRKWTRLNPWP